MSLRQYGRPKPLPEPWAAAATCLVPKGTPWNWSITASLKSQWCHLKSLGCHQKMRPSGSAVNEVRCLNPRLGSHLPMQLRELWWIVQTYVEDPRIAPTRRYRRVIWFEVLRLLAQPSTEVYLWKTRIQTFNALHQKTCSMSFSSLFWIYRACARMLSSWKQTQLARISMPV